MLSSAGMKQAKLMFGLEAKSTLVQYLKPWWKLCEGLEGGGMVGLDSQCRFVVNT